MVHAEPTGDHQANGRGHGGSFEIQGQSLGFLDRRGDGPIFGCLHPVYAWWVLVHSVWLHNHFAVRNAMASYEGSTGRFYFGKVAHSSGVLEDQSEGIATVDERRVAQ